LTERPYITYTTKLVELSQFVLGRRSPVIRRLAGVIVIVGALFIVLADRPVIDEFFSASSEEAKVQAIQANPDDWDFVMTMWSIAGAVAVVGLGAFALALHRTSADARLKRLSLVGLVAGGVGALSWLYLCYNRATLPVEEVAAHQNIAWWPVFGFVIPMIIGVALAGFIVSRGYSKWGGRLVVVLAVAGTPLEVFLPLVTFGPLLTLGVVLLVARLSDIERAPRAIPAT
jgi:hypothetical protein